MAEHPILFMRSPYAPLEIDRAEGPGCMRDDGRKILDAGAGAVVVNIGQGREEIAGSQRKKSNASTMSYRCGRLQRANG